MLFGVSLFLVGGEPSAPGGSQRLARRFGWLALFGIIHGALIWHGDVLFDYAVCGFLIMGMRGWDGPQLIVWGVVAYIVGAVLMAGLIGLAANSPDLEALIRPWQPGAATDYAGSFWASLGANIQTWAHYRVISTLHMISYAAPLMLIGLGLFKTGAFTGKRETALYAAAATVALLAVLAMAYNAQSLIASGFETSGDLWSANAIYLTSPFIALGYIALLALTARIGLLAWLIPMLAPLGRMAFTNYIAQSVLVTAIFYGGRGPALFDRVDRPGLALVVLAIWALQLVWSHLWLRQFQYGPLEWLWHGLTYGRFAPIRRARATASAMMDGASRLV
jgi:uncharacterized protein